MKAERIVGILAVVIIFIVAMGSLVWATEPGKKTDSFSSGLEDQKGIALTIYNVNLGLVKDLRELRIQEGTGELKFMDVASQIIPTSVHIRSIVNPDSLQV